jgi:hypothetical protein
MLYISISLNLIYLQLQFGSSRRLNYLFLQIMLANLIGSLFSHLKINRNDADYIYTSITHNLNFCGLIWTCEGSLEWSKHLDDFQLGLDGQQHLWPTLQSGQDLEFPIQGMMVLYRSEISC